MTAPLRDRFGILQRLQFYSPEELTEILQCAAQKLNLPLTSEGAYEIGRRARGTPRIAHRLLRRVRDFAQVRRVSPINIEVAHLALELLKVDEGGLDEQDRRLLWIMIHQFRGGPVGLDHLAAILGEERTTLEDVVEPYLIQQGYLMRTPRGRVIAPLAYRHFNLQPLENDEENS